MIKKTFAEYRNEKRNKQSKMRMVRNFLKTSNNFSDQIETNNYRSGSRRRDPQKEMLLYKMMIRSRKNKLEKIGDRKYKLKN
ncbi:MAG: hypothetical protein ACOCQZ_02785 [Halanaerobium sp.]